MTRAEEQALKNHTFIGLNFYEIERLKEEFLAGYKQAEKDTREEIAKQLSKQWNDGYNNGYEQAIKDTKKELNKRLKSLWGEIPDASDVEKDNISKEQAFNLGKYNALESFEHFVETLR